MNARLLLLPSSLLLALACGSESGPGNPNQPNPIVGQAGSGGPSMMEAPAPTAGSAGGAGGSDAAGGSGAVAGSSAAGGSGGSGSDAGAGSGGAGSQPVAGGGAGGSGSTIDPAMPFGPNVDFFAWSTETFSLEAGQERYLCYAKTLEQDLVINAYNSVGDRFVHHVIFSRASAPEPEGFAECDIAFRSSWEPVFITGAGDTMLEFPSDAGHELNQGTQMIVQMHLLNLATEPVEGSLTINMRRSTEANPRPVSSFIFGTAAVELPAGQTSQVVGTCSPWQPLQLIAGFPHMHMLGTAMRFEVGAGGGPMQEVFKRDPFDFDNQRIDPLDLTIAAGDVTRVTCTFDNTLDQTVTYGESTKNEMCYFIGFAVDLPRQSACLEVLPPDIFGN